MLPTLYNRNHIKNLKLKLKKKSVTFIILSMYLTIIYNLALKYMTIINILARYFMIYIEFRAIH